MIDSAIILASFIVVWMNFTFALSTTEPPSTGSSPIPPAPPISVPVWSLAACTDSLSSVISSDASSSSTSTTSMNIVTFCTPLSVAPPKLYAVSLYHNTLTKDSFLASGRGILQLLRPQHKNLIPLLGKSSGYTEGVDKYAACAKQGWEWVDYDEKGQRVQVLPDCASYTELQVESTVLAGDHTLAICRVVGVKQWEGSKLVESSFTPESLGPSEVLYTGLLRQEGII